MSTPQKIAFIFPGQGSQYVGMSKAFYDQFPAARQTFEEANDVLGFDLKNLCFEGSLGELSMTQNALPAIFTSSVAAFRIFMNEYGIRPQVCAGHSLGEYSALTCSGAFRFADALRIVQLRSLLAHEIADAGDSCMTIIDGIDPFTVENTCKESSTEEKPATVSCYNSLKQAAVSGHLDTVLSVEDKILKLGGQVTPLIGSAPFHCALMKPAADKLKAELEKCNFSSFRYPVISNCTGKPYPSHNDIVDLLARQMMYPVQWTKTLEYFQVLGITMTIELGPQGILSDLLKLDAKNISTVCFDQKTSRQALAGLLEGSGYTEKMQNKVITDCLTAAAVAPNYNSCEEEYLKGVVEPYEKIRKIQSFIEKEFVEPSKEQVEEALQMLALIFSTKKLPIDVQTEALQNILNKNGIQDDFNWNGEKEANKQETI